MCILPELSDITYYISPGVEYTDSTVQVGLTLTVRCSGTVLDQITCQTPGNQMNLPDRCVAANTGEAVRG